MYYDARHLQNALIATHEELQIFWDGIYDLKLDLLIMLC